MSDEDEPDWVKHRQLEHPYSDERTDYLPSTHSAPLELEAALELERVRREAKERAAL